MKIFLAISLLMIAAPIFAQDKPEPVLFDSISKASCEAYLARSDLFGVELEKSATSHGVLVWYGDGETGHLADVLATFMHRALINRFGNDLKVTVLRSTKRPDLMAEAWLVPNGVEFTIPMSTVVAEIPFKVTKRTLYAESGPGPCSNFDNYGFATILLSDPNLNGVIVVRSSSNSNRAEDVADILNQFQELRINRDRLRIFFKRPTPKDGGLGYLELWLVPEMKQ
jgi:hypothetical protein